MLTLSTCSQAKIYRRLEKLSKNYYKKKYCKFTRIEKNNLLRIFCQSYTYVFFIQKKAMNEMNVTDGHSLLPKWYGHEV